MKYEGNTKLHSMEDVTAAIQKIVDDPSERHDPDEDPPSEEAIKGIKEIIEKVSPFMGFPTFLHQWGGRNLFAEYFCDLPEGHWCPGPWKLSLEVDQDGKIWSYMLPRDPQINKDLEWDGLMADEPAHVDALVEWLSDWRANRKSKYNPGG